MLAHDDRHGLVRDEVAEENWNLKLEFAAPRALVCESSVLHQKEAVARRAGEFDAVNRLMVAKVARRRFLLPLKQLTDGGVNHLEYGSVDSFNAFFFLGFVEVKANFFQTHLKLLSKSVAVRYEHPSVLV